MIDCISSLNNGFEVTYNSQKGGGDRSLLNYIEYFYRYLDRLYQLPSNELDDVTVANIIDLYCDIRIFYGRAMDSLAKGTQLSSRILNSK